MAIELFGVAHRALPLALCLSVISYFFSASNVPVMIGETYANGDGTDSWCHTNKILETQFYQSSTYIVPTCLSTWCFVADFSYTHLISKDGIDCDVTIDYLFFMCN